MVPSMAKVSLSGPMVPNMMENSMKIKFKEKDVIFGLTRDNI